MGNPFRITDTGAATPHRYAVELRCGAFQSDFFKEHALTESGFLWEKAASYFWKTQADCLYPVWYESEQDVFRIRFDSFVIARAFAKLFYKKCRSRPFLCSAFDIAGQTAPHTSKDVHFLNF
ncbi:MAG: hypothetical protein Q4G07_12140 [Oscillospiraceae bacterium]|nr:hypothetical protein [Oscillospiraceae bacterium]